MSLINDIDLQVEHIERSFHQSTWWRFTLAVANSLRMLARHNQASDERLQAQVDELRARVERLEAEAQEEVA